MFEAILDTACIIAKKQMHFTLILWLTWAVILTINPSLN